MKKVIFTTIFLLYIFIICPVNTYSSDNATIELLQTGMFHGQVALGGMKDSIYYFEKSLNINDADSVAASEAKEAIKTAKEAYKLYEKSLNLVQSRFNAMTKKK